jgi:hypothetical protein
LMRTVLRLVGVGWYVAICLLGGSLGGVWLDNRAGSSPLFILLGLGAGLAVAAFGTYRMLAAVLSEDSGYEGPE